MAARLRSLYLSSHSLEMAWMDKHAKQTQLLKRFHWNFTNLVQFTLVKPAYKHATHGNGY